MSSQHTTPSTLPSRRRWVIGIAASWTVMMVAGLLYLGRSCPVAGPTLLPKEAKGWKIRMLVPASTDGVETIMAHFSTTPPRRDLDVELCLPAEIPHGSIQHLGWQIRDEPPGRTISVPMLEITDPAGTMRWSGILPIADLAVPGARILDRELLARVVRGESTPPIVPIGCAPPGA